MEDSTLPKKRSRDEVDDMDEGMTESQPKRVKTSEDLKEALHYTIISSPDEDSGDCPETYLVRHKERAKRDEFINWWQKLETTDKSSHDLVACAIFCNASENNGHFTLQEAIEHADVVNSRHYKCHPEAKIKNDATLAKLLEFDLGHWEEVKMKHDGILDLEPKPESVRFTYVFDWC